MQIHSKIILHKQSHFYFFCIVYWFVFVSIFLTIFCGTSISLFLWHWQRRRHLSSEICDSLAWQTRHESWNQQVWILTSAAVEGAEPKAPLLFTSLFFFLSEGVTERFLSPDTSAAIFKQEQQTSNLCEEEFFLLLERATDLWFACIPMKTNQTSFLNTRPSTSSSRCQSFIRSVQCGGRQWRRRRGASCEALTWGDDSGSRHSRNDVAETKGAGQGRPRSVPRPLWCSWQEAAPTQSEARLFLQRKQWISPAPSVKAGVTVRTCTAPPGSDINTLTKSS